MITEDYVSFETAKLLKEKGFNEYCMAFRSPNSVGAKGLFYSQHSIRNYEEGKTIGAAVACPTLQMAMKWLREVHDIYIMIDKDFVTENGWHYVVVRKQDWANNADNGLIQQESNNYTYEEASEAAIRYCLENLI